MNQLEAVFGGDSKLAFIGQDGESFSLLHKWAELVPLTYLDSSWKTIEDTLAKARGSEERPKPSNTYVVESPQDWSACSLFYVTGFSNLSTGWEDFQNQVIAIARVMPKHSWIIFGSSIDPDVVEVLAVNLIEKYSGFRLSESFHIAFEPPFAEDQPWDKLSNELKMSHNLIINALEPLFKDRGRAKDFRLSYRNESMELQNIEEQVKKIWVPALNQMNSETFSEFLRAAYFEEFLDPYKNLRLKSEWRVDIDRFFTFALRNGLKSSAREILESTAMRLQEGTWSTKHLTSEEVLTYSLF